MQALTAAESERELHDLIAMRDVWEICRSLPDLFMEFDVLAMVLFGSRARGDNDIDSDIDVAVILRGCTPWSEYRRKLNKAFVDITCPIELETGLLVSALAVPVEYMRDPGLSKNTALYEKILEEGLIFWELGDAVDPPAKWHRSGQALS